MKNILFILFLFPLFANAQNDAAKTKPYKKYGGKFVRIIVGNSIGFQVDSTGKIIRYNNSVVTDGQLAIGDTGNGMILGSILSADGSITVTNSAGGIDLAVAGADSTYTPTLTNTTNIAASTAYTTHYTRVGDWIYVWGEVEIDATAATTISEMGMSLPVSTSIPATKDLAGTASFEDNTSVLIKGDVSNNRAMFRFTPQTNTNNKYSFHFSYKYTAP